MDDWLQDDPATVAAAAFATLALALLGAILLGVRLGRRRRGETAVPGEGAPGTAAVEGTVFAVLGLLMAFAFSGAAERWQTRRALLLSEAQAVGTAWCTFDVLDEPARLDLQARLRQYLSIRLAAYRAPRLADAQRALDQAEELGRSAYTAAAQACREPAGQAFAEIVLPPLTTMLDAALARRVALTHHVHPVVLGLLVGLSLVAGLLVGVSMGRGARRPWLHITVFAVALAAILYVTFDLELPRRGLLRITASDAPLEDLLRSMGG
jgi:hypothetical protein